MTVRSRVLTFALASALFITAREASAQEQRAWVDVNFGVATSVADEEAYAFDYTLFNEPAALAAVYPKPSRGAAFDFGGGFMFTPKIGVGISFSGAAHEDTAGLGATIPHPFFFNSSATGGATTDEKLTRTEGATHLQAMFVPVHTPNLRVRLFGGPSFFRYKAEMVQDITYRQVAGVFSRLNTVTITNYDQVDVDGNGVGFHLGGDVSYFFTRVFGLGAFGRFSRGTVTIDEPLSESEQDVTVGGFQFGGGLRFRF